MDFCLIEKRIVLWVGVFSGETVLVSRIISSGVANIVGIKNVFCYVEGLRCVVTFLCSRKKGEQ